MTIETTTEPTTTTAKTTTPPHKIIVAPADSLSYVLSRWGRAVLRRVDGFPAPGFLHDFAIKQAQIIKRSRVLVAIGEDTRIMSFIVFQFGILHWIHTRTEHRNRGLGHAMMSAAEITPASTITSWTMDLRRIGMANSPHKPFWLEQYE